MQSDGKDATYMFYSEIQWRSRHQKFWWDNCQWYFFRSRVATCYQDNSELSSRQLWRCSMLIDFCLKHWRILGVWEVWQAGKPQQAQAELWHTGITAINIVLPCWCPTQSPPLIDLYPGGGYWGEAAPDPGGCSRHWGGRRACLRLWNQVGNNYTGCFFSTGPPLKISRLAPPP